MDEANPLAPPNETTQQRQSWGGWLFGHGIAFLFCILFPAFVTAVAPISRIWFVREDGVVSATAKTYLLFLIPYRTQHVSPVIGIDDRLIAGKVERRPGKDRTRSEDEAFLVINGNDTAAEVPVTPFNIESVSRRSQEFLDNPVSSALTMTVVANWKFSVLMGGMVSLLTVLYVVGLVWGLWRGLLRIASPPVDMNR